MFEEGLKTEDVMAAPTQPAEEPLEPIKKRLEATPTPTPTTVPPLKEGESFAINPKARSVQNTVATASRAAIRAAANEFGVDPAVMEDIAFAESSLDHTNVGPTEDVGLFQFVPGTWKETMKRMGLTEDLDRKNPLLNARAAGFLMSKGECSRWNNSKFKKDENGNETGWGQFHPGI